MTCLRCQTRDAATATGNEAALIEELYRQLDRALDGDVTAPVPCEEVVPRAEHERTVETLNARIVALNAEVDRLRKAHR